MRKTVLISLLILFGVENLPAQTTAHQRSRYAIIDPFYSSDKLFPDSGLRIIGASWIYGPTELEAWRLQLLRERKDSAKLKVGYPGTYHQAYGSASFRLKLNGRDADEKLLFRAVGKGKVFLNDKEISGFDAGESFKSISLSKGTDVKSLRFDLSTSGEPPRC